MKKTLAILLSVLVMVSFSIGCAGTNTTSNAPLESSQNSGTETNAASKAETNSSDQNITLNILSIAPDWEEKMAPILRKFESENPGITLVPEHYPRDRFFQIIEVKFSSNSNEYDVFTVDGPLTAAYAERGYVRSLDEFFTNDEKEQYTTASLNAGTWQEQFYAAPLNNSSQLLFFNTELLDAAGISYPSSKIEDRITWDELLDMAEKVQKSVDPDGSQSISGLMFEQVSRPYQMLALPNGLGGKSIGDDGFTVEGVIDSPEWTQALKWYQETFETGISLKGMPQEQVSANFYAGKIAFMVGGVWNVATAAAKEFTTLGYAPHPYFAGHDPVTPTGSWHYGIPPTSQNAEAAALYIKYMTLGEGNEMWLEANGDIPCTTAAVERIANDPSYNEAPRSVMKIAAYESGHTAYPRPITPGYTEYETILTNLFEDVRNGIDISEAQKDAIIQANSVMAKYK